MLSTFSEANAIHISATGFPNNKFHRFNDATSQVKIADRVPPVF
jgi:hypothetical protein